MLVGSRCGLHELQPELCGGVLELEQLARLLVALRGDLRLGHFNHGFQRVRLRALPFPRPSVENVAKGNQVVPAWFDRAHFDRHPSRDRDLGLAARERAQVLRGPEHFVVVVVFHFSPVCVVLLIVTAYFRTPTVGLVGLGNRVAPKVILKGCAASRRVERVLL